MADIPTIAALGTAAGTLFLGAATFASTRSANRAARIAERSLLLGLRPVLTPSRPEDPDIEILFGDGAVFRIPAGHGLVERRDGVIYLAIALRNVGAGLAVLQRYDIIPENPFREARRPSDPNLRVRSERSFRPIEGFRAQQRDLYIAGGDIGYWQAALRDEKEDLHAAVGNAIESREPISIDLLYGDHEGGQSTVSRFSLVPGEEGWLTSVAFHWVLGADDPRQE